jgi:hypothetical protein
MNARIMHDALCKKEKFILVSKVIFQNDFDKIEGVYNVLPLSPLEINGKIFSWMHDYA